MRAIALVLSLMLVTPAFGMGAWDGLKVEQGSEYETGPDHPAFSGQSAVGSTLGVAGLPIYMASMTSQAGFAKVQEVTGFAWVPVQMAIGTWLEARTAPSKVGMHEYNGHVVTGESAKWERDPDHVGWNRLARYSTFGPGVDKTHDTGMAFDRIGG